MTFTDIINKLKVSNLSPSSGQGWLTNGNNTQNSASYYDTNLRGTQFDYTNGGNTQPQNVPMSNIPLNIGDIPNGALTDQAGNPIVQRPSVTNTRPTTIISSRPVQRQAYSALNQLNTIESEPDPYLQFLQGRLTNTNGQDSIENQRIVAQNDANERKTNENYGRYQAGIETAMINSNQNVFQPTAYEGAILQAKKEKDLKLAELQDKENLLLAKAKEARQQKSYKDLTTYMKYVSDVRKEKYKAIEDAKKLEWDMQKFNLTRADKWGMFNMRQATKKSSLDTGDNADDKFSVIDSILKDSYDTTPGNEDYLNSQNFQNILILGKKQGLKESEILDKYAGNMSKYGLRKNSYNLTPAQIKYVKSVK